MKSSKFELYIRKYGDNGNREKKTSVSKETRAELITTIMLSKSPIKLDDMLEQVDSQYCEEHDATTGKHHETYRVYRICKQVFKAAGLTNAVVE